MKLSKKFVGFYLSGLVLSTFGFFDILNDQEPSNVFELIFKDFFFFLDYLLISAYCIYIWHNYKSVYRSFYVLSYGLSFFVLFAFQILEESIGASYFDRFELITPDIGLTILLVRIFHVFYFISLGLVLSKRRVLKPILTTMALFGLLILFLSQMRIEAKEVLMIKTGILSLFTLFGLWLVVLYLGSYERVFDHYLIIFITGLFVTEVYYTSYSFEEWLSLNFNKNLGVSIRLVGSVCELGLLGVLASKYWIKDPVKH